MHIGDPPNVSSEMARPQLPMLPVVAEEEEMMVPRSMLSQDISVLRIAVSDAEIASSIAQHHVRAVGRTNIGGADVVAEDRDIVV